MKMIVSLSSTNQRKQHADRIRGLMVDAANNVIALGKELAAAREDFPKQGNRHRRVGWADWLRDEFDMSESHANTLMQIADRFDHVSLAALGGERPSINVLAILSGKVPEKAKREITRRLKAGEKVGRRMARKIVDKHLATPSQARKQAHETGKAVPATDGYVYFGATKEQEESIKLRRDIVYGVHRAVETLAKMPMSPHEFLQYALPHQLWNKQEEGMIKDATEWLRALNTAWECRK